ncbi:GrpB family protein [Domibacillus indicus]|uniref:GrpB family protein n=1 Tax=Domibacillus indicus TaxID=1437523 RepID=UPI00288C2D46|nr:GrpB family protein [Domibacillus indicus]
MKRWLKQDTILRGKNGITGLRFLGKGDSLRTYHVHVYQSGSQHIVRHLAFRDYIRAHLEVCEQNMENSRVSWLLNIQTI